METPRAKVKKEERRKHQYFLPQPVSMFGGEVFWAEGKGGATKSDEFSEKFQTAFDPPSFSENYVAIFLWNACTWFPKIGTILRGVGEDRMPFGTFPKIHLIW